MKRIVFLAVFLIIGLIGFRFRLRSQNVVLPDVKTIQEKTGLPVRVEKPRRVTLKETVDLVGHLEGRLQSAAVFEIAGRLDELTPQVGDVVSAGQVIGKLDSRDQEASVAVARAALAAANAQLEKAERGPRKQELKAARARTAEAQAGYKLARDELNRIKSLVAKRAAAQQQLDQAQSNFAMARARKNQADESVKLLEEGTRSEDKAAARAQVQLAMAQLDLATLRLEKHTLKVPLSGVVYERVVEPGDFMKTVPEPQPTVRIVSIDPIVFVAKVSELYIAQLGKEAEVAVRVDALPGETFNAKVHEVCPLGETHSRSFRVEFAIDNPQGRLKPAMFARARLVLRKREAALTVPRFVLRVPEGLETLDEAPEACLPNNKDEIFKGRGHKAIVMVVHEGRAAARAVRAGLIESGRAEVVAGLKPSDVVIVDGFEEIKAGQSVTYGQGDRGEGGV